MTVTQDEPMVTNYCGMCEAKAKRIEALGSENARLCAALLSIAETGTDFMVGLDENMERIRAFARQALGETQ